MATCAPIQDDDFSTFVFSCFAAERGDSCQAGALFGDDQPLCCPADLTSDLTSDLVDPDPDLELPDLDVSDLDTDGFFGALKWYGEQAGFQDKSDDDTEDSLLAALAEGLSSIDGISCLDGIGGLACSPPGGACGDGGSSGGDDDEMASLHTLVAAARPIAAETADTPAEEEEEEEGDEWQELEEKQQREPSLLKKLLLAPANTQLSYEHRVGGSVRCRGGGGSGATATASSAQAAVRPHKLPLPLKPKPLLSGRSAPNCTELLRYLCTDEDPSPSHSETRATRGGGRPKKKAAAAATATATQPQATQAARFTYREAKAPSLSLPLTPNSPGEGKSFSSSFENKTLDRTLSAELSSTAGLTPPTTPPHKQQHLDSLLSFRASKHKQSALGRCESGAAKRVRGSLVVACASGVAGGAGGRALEQSELYAQLRKAMVGKPAGQGAGGERRVGKKPSPRLFGDHDYCQAATAAPRCVLIAPPHAGHAHHRQHQRRPTPAAPAPVLAVTPAAAPAQTLAAAPAPQPWARRAAPRVRRDSLRSEVSAESCEAAEEEAAARRKYDGERLSQCSSSSSSGVFDSDDEDPEEGDAEKLHRSGKTAPPPPQQPLCVPARPEPGRESRSAPVSRRNSMCKSPAGCGSDGEEGIDARGGGGRERRRAGGWEGPPPGASGGGWGSQPGSPAASPPFRDSPPFVMSSPSSPLQARAHGHDRSRSRSGSPPAYGRFLHHRSRSGSPCWTRFSSPPSQTLLYQHQSRYECDDYERSKREEHRREYEKREIERAKQRERQREKAFEERRVVHVGRLPSDLSRSDLQKRFEVFGDIEECVINLRDNGESYAFLTFRFTCDACAAVQSGHTLSRPGECHLDIGYGGRRLSCRTGYTDLDPTTDDFDPTASKSKYDTMDFDSLLREAQCSLRR
ncbi:peroxisome proliferator-activated receptor gamma coactivator 1-alpha-like isoform X1 [Lethenteron reissneri]|uniref:peroxisome proliferator-activated receptor gamma coactivator 1-alpha-like isoform X1 n=1 Tax=Lethenteron reissneri TaxID=7753 RepID=UPI002AB6BB9F|nr:peroxisome proliferator-activated receptor gamma coactivator 1-alpha-like isoform X1 [Lethenteron reissneri]